MDDLLTRIQDHPHRLFSLGHPFLPTLAKSLIALCQRSGCPPEACTIFLPYEKAIPLLRHEWLKASGTPVAALPKLLTFDQPLGYAGSACLARPCASALHMKGWMVRMIRHYHQRGSFEHTLALAEALLSLWEQVDTHGGRWEKLMDIIPEHLTHHFQITLKFLNLLQTRWPAFRHKYASRYETHSQGVDILCQEWQSSPPQHWVIAAGSCATLPATKTLLKTIMRLPKGGVIFPFVPEMIPCDLSAVSSAHPLYTLHQFLKDCGLTGRDVRPWLPSGEEAKKRAYFFLQTCEPLLAMRSDMAPQGLHYLPCASPRDEAFHITQLLKQGFPHKKTVFITSDPDLAYRVQCELRQAGIPLPLPQGLAFLHHPTATFLALLLRGLTKRWDFLTLVSLWKHPFIQEKYPIRLLTLMERWMMRGTRTQDEDTLTFLQRRSQHTPYPRLFKRAIRRFMTLIQPLEVRRGHRLSLKRWVTLICRVAEMMVSSRLWYKEGRQIADFLHQLCLSSGAYPMLEAEEFLTLLDYFFKTYTFTNSQDPEARLQISTPLEARLMEADRVVIGGLNEGSWPPQNLANPWLNRLMKDHLSLPPDQWRVGLSGRDFLCLLGADEIFLTRALKYQGVATLPSRFLTRMDTLMTLCKQPWIVATLPTLPPAGPVQGLGPPAPCPPIEARPRRLSISDILLLQRDPYEFYLRKILNLRPLDPLGWAWGKKEEGSYIHQLLEVLIRQNPPPNPDLNLNKIQALLIQGPTDFFWAPKLEEMLAWFQQTESHYRQGLPYRSLLEVSGQAPLLADIILTAKADRIDCFEDNTIRIIDYKTGRLPSLQDPSQGPALQLILEAFIAMQGGFPGLPTHLEWWGVGVRSGKHVIKGYHQEIAQKVAETLQRLQPELQRLLCTPAPYLSSEDSYIPLLTRQEEWQ